ncbi:sarcoplasmic calcium-binding protein-like [Ruditapes philippinarum]|uniref:sarcoplasmic calcium-binding protein-like n=1 Tax=Ruditapes philippinarum TaxID=129788 RepID=UPI00295B2EBA|nr:sarcoplasmic calcium-binding protein-like [Ruditapes philippinarum]
MANDYLKSKWRLWFRLYDVKHKNKLSGEDVKEKEERFAAINHLDPEQKKKVIETMDKLLSENVFYGKPGPITEDEFVEMQNDDFKADKDKYVEKRRKYFTTVFSMVDLCGEGITEEEFVNAFKALGHDNVSLDKKFFHDFKPVDGKIPRSVFVDALVQFTTCEDSSKEDLVKTGLESGV